MMIMTKIENVLGVMVHGIMEMVQQMYRNMYSKKHLVNIAKAEVLYSF